MGDIHDAKCWLLILRTKAPLCACNAHTYTSCAVHAAFFTSLTSSLRLSPDLCVLCAVKCSLPSGCGVRNTSTTSSCPLPSTARGPRGTRTSTTARGKRRELELLGRRELELRIRIRAPRGAYLAAVILYKARRGQSIPNQVCLIIQPHLESAMRR